MLVATNNETLLAKGLKVLGDGLSLAMLRALLVNGAATASELARRFQCKQWTAWRHLEELCKAGLIQRQARRGKAGQVLYVALKDRITAFFAAAMSYAGITQESPV